MNFSRIYVPSWFYVAFFAFAFIGCALGGENSANPLQRETPAIVQWEIQQFPIDPAWSKKDLELPMVLAGLPEELPEYFVLEGLLAPGDQGLQASSTAWAAGYTANSYLQRKTNGRKDYVCSAAFIYNQLNKQNNESVSILDSLRLLKKQGCPNERYMPYQPRNYAYQPGSRAREDAERYTIQGFGRVDFIDEAQVKAHLLQNRIVIVRLRVSQNFIKLKDDIWRNPAGHMLGARTVALVGYDDRKRVFLMQNSAGGRWGSYGRAGIPYDWFIRLAARAYVIW